MRGRKKKVKDEEITAVVRSENDPVITTSEVAEKIDLTKGRTYQRLEKLHEDSNNEIQRKKLGKKHGRKANTHVWWTPSDPELPLMIQKIADRKIDINNSIQQLPLPGTDVVLELRKIAVQMAYERVGDGGEEPLNTIVDHVMRYNPAGFRFQRTALRDMLLQSMRDLDQVQVEDGEDIIIKR